jgi:translation initiation factor RLI1
MHTSRLIRRLIRRLVLLIVVIEQLLHLLFEEIHGGRLWLNKGKVRRHKSAETDGQLSAGLERYLKQTGSGLRADSGRGTCEGAWSMHDRKEEQRGHACW